MHSCVMCTRAAELELKCSIPIPNPQIFSTSTPQHNVNEEWLSTAKQ